MELRDLEITLLDHTLDLSRHCWGGVRWLGNTTRGPGKAEVWDREVGSVCVSALLVIALRLGWHDSD